MYIVHVFVHVKPEHWHAFKAATIENARNSVKEPGIARFDVIQQADDPTRFVLVEVYRTPDDPAKHKETRTTTSGAKRASRCWPSRARGSLYGNVFPDEQGWG